MKKLETEVHLSREMSLFDVTLIGVGIADDAVILDHFVVHGNHPLDGWFAVRQTDGPNRLFRTTDGGRTWDLSVVQ